MTNETNTTQVRPSGWDNRTANAFDNQEDETDMPSQPPPSILPILSQYPTITPAGHDQHGLGDWCLNTSFSWFQQIVREAGVANATPSEATFIDFHGTGERGAKLDNRDCKWNLRRLKADVRRAEAGSRKMPKRAGTIIWQPHYPGIEPKETLSVWRGLCRQALEIIRDQSQLNLCVLVNGPAVLRERNLLRSFRDRLIFGAAIPTMQADLLKLYEADTPPPVHRLVALGAAKADGLRVFVALSPVLPASDVDDFVATFKQISLFEPTTIFCRSPQRRTNCRRFLEQVKSLEQVARSFGIQESLRFWPGREFGHQRVVNEQPDPKAYRKWLKDCWNQRVL